MLSYNKGSKMNIPFQFIVKSGLSYYLSSIFLGISFFSAIMLITSFKVHIFISSLTILSMLVTYYCLLILSAKKYKCNLVLKESKKQLMVITIMGLIGIFLSILFNDLSEFIWLFFIILISFLIFPKIILKKCV
jgi:hypothetical protein